MVCLRQSIVFWAECCGVLRCVSGRVLCFGQSVVVGIAGQVNHHAAAGSPTPEQGPQKCSDPGYQFTIMNKTVATSTRLIQL